MGDAEGIAGGAMKAPIGAHLSLARFTRAAVSIATMPSSARS